MTRVKDEMVTDPIAASVPGTRRELLQLFRRHGHAAFPVVKAGASKLVGLVTRHHVLDQPEEAQIALLMDPNPPTTYPEAPLREAARLLVEHDLRLLPAVSGANDLVGVITAKEILDALPAPSGHIASRLRRLSAPTYAGTPIRVALEILKQRRVDALPILDDEARFAGIVTDGDLLASGQVTEQTIRTTSGHASEGDAWAWQEVRDARRVQHTTTSLTWTSAPVGSIARTPPRTLGINASLRDALELLEEPGVHHVVVVDEEGRLVDLLGELDLLAALVTPSR